ncbi:hypothetical protein [Roseateles sp. BYS87W]|uniref:Uncharacterized protein n=1 Tax=Pelomonas baiyunensis TaxID=3299026 RepID=A0ABW7GZ29_9BURK
MPNVVLAGEVFSLDASAGFDEGLVRGQVGASARLNFTTRFTACHGLAVQAGAQARADASAQLVLLGLLSGDAQGAALASAGARLVATATVDPFDRAGLDVSVAAYAEASVAGRLAVSLDLQDVARLAAARLDGPALEIFLALLGEIRLGAGVWARLGVAAMARGEISVLLSLADDNHAGFVIAGGLAVGAAAGAGVDVYAGARFESPKRFFLNAVNIATGALVTEARKHLPPALTLPLAALEFALPALLHAAYEIAQIDTAALAARPAVAGEVFAACMGAELQRFVLDQLARGAAARLAAQLDAVMDRLAAAPPSDVATRTAAAVQAALDALASMEGEGWTLTRATEALPRLVALLDALDAAERSTCRTALAALWLSLAAAQALRQGVVAAQASASAGVLGLATQVSQVIQIEIRDVPAFVQDELHARLGLPRDSRLSFANAVAWLIDSRLLPQLRAALPELAPLLDLIEQELDVGDLLTAALRGDLRLRYAPCRALASRLLDGLLIQQLLPALAGALPDDAPTRLWTDEVVRPSLLMLRDFVLARLDDAVAGRALQQEPLRAALGLLVGKVVISHVVVLRDILVDHVRDHAAEAARDLADALRDGRRTPLAQAFHTVAQPLAAAVGGVIPSAVMLEASRELAADLLLVLASATGEQVWTDARRARERELLRRILFSVYGEADRADPNRFMADIAACAYVPAPQAVKDMVVLQAEAMAATLGQTLSATVAALERFFARLGEGLVQRIEVGLAAGLARLRDDLVVLGRTLVVLSRQADARLAEAERWAREMSRQLDNAAAACRSAARRQQILDRLQRDGIANARAFARQVPGFAQLPRDARAAALNVAGAAFATAFAGIRPLLDGALQVLRAVGDDIARLFAAAADATALTRALTQAITDRLDAAVRAVANLQLPRELSITAIVKAAVDVITQLPPLRDALRLAFSARENEQAARTRLRQTRTQIATQTQAQEAQQRALDAALGGGPLGLNICSPLGIAADLQAACAYHASIPIRIVVAGLPAPSNPTMDGQAVLLLNGDALSVPDTAWQHTDGLSRLSLQLASTHRAIRPGLNVLEFACAQGGRPAQRVRKTFLVHPGAAPTDGLRVRVVNAALEISSTGPAPLTPQSLQGWRVVVPGGQVLRGVLTAGQPTPLSALAPRPAPGPSPRPHGAPGLPRVQSGPSAPVTPVTPGGLSNLRPLRLTPCLRAITVIDAAGRHRLDHLLGDDD